MVSINLSDFFHDMLIIQALRPVQNCVYQWVPSLAATPLKCFELMPRKGRRMPRLGTRMLGVNYISQSNGFD